MTRRTFLLSLEPLFEGRPGVAVVVEVSTNRVVESRGLERAGLLLAAPGSTMKPFVLQALLEEGRLPKQTGLSCDKRFGCTHAPLGRAVDPVTAIAYSCNSWFAQMSGRLEAADFHLRLERLGLGTRTGWAASESAGEIEAARSQEDLRQQALGLRGIRVTPLGVAEAYRRLAVLRGQNAAALQPVFAGLEGAVSYGTAQGARARGLAVAGKTGTSAEGAWFAGYAPSARPEVAAVVFLERGRGGSDAAPVAAKVFEAWASGR